ncbi:MAG: Zn-ribbon domain-containing OB-fold protein [Planctomycetales bacterium]|nr:Zn-ribbon domain-containing OB-fold protein [Planctomycetales bacterium]
MIPHVETNQDLRAWPGDIPVEHLYTAGPAGDAALRAMKERAALLGSRCNACAVTYVPARYFCERCFARLNETVDVPARGIVKAVAVVSEDRDRKPLRKPVVLGLVALEGATGVFLHRLGVKKLDQAKVGARVEAVWKPPEERTGSVEDLLHFRVV